MNSPTAGVISSVTDPGAHHRQGGPQVSPLWRSILWPRPKAADSGEAILLFGGITAIPVVILTAVGLPEAMFELLMIGGWFASAVVPDVWLARRLTSRQAISWLLGVQTGFSLAQAVVGALMIFGKAA